MSQLFRRKSVESIIEMAGEDSHIQNEVSGTKKISSENHKLRRTLKLRDITSLGIAAIIGAGIFGTIGEASHSGGPAVILLFVFIAIACGFSALCYAEFSSAIPLSGSAYTYAYVAFGEIIAWTIGWDLVIEYAVGNIVVAISWSDYFSEFLKGIGLHIPECFTMDYLTAFRKFPEAEKLVSSGTAITDLPRQLKESYLAWTTAPEIAGFKIIADFPALLIVIFITALVYIGIRESKKVGNAMVALKIGVIIMVIIIGAFYVQPENWVPFAPNGFAGVMKGVAAVFFAFIGFDALSTTSEECVNPRRDLPRAIILSLIVCTILYILIALVLTGLVSYKELNVGDPLAYAFKQANLPKEMANWVSGIIAMSAIIAMASVLLVFQMGQPRIWMSMSRDGLLPSIFSRIHPRFFTPWFATLITGLVVAIPCLLMNLSEVTELSSIGTLFAFCLVCGGVLRLQVKKSSHYKPGFKVPYINGRYVVPIGFILVWAILWFYRAETIKDIFSFHSDIKIPVYIFILGTILLTIATYIYRLSLIPVLGLISCLYLMSQVETASWLRFAIWLVVGQIIYFLYGFRNSKLNTNKNV